LVEFCPIQGSGIALGEHSEGDGAQVFAAACKVGLEGIVSKRRDMRYIAGKCKAWVKVKDPTRPMRLDDEEWNWGERSAKR
jgi:ATP-dependent DNA ligase